MPVQQGSPVCFRRHILSQVEHAHMLLDYGTVDICSFYFVLFHKAVYIGNGFFNSGSLFSVAHDILGPSYILLLHEPGELGGDLGQHVLEVITVINVRQPCVLLLQKEHPLPQYVGVSGWFSVLDSKEHVRHIGSHDHYLVSVEFGRSQVRKLGNVIHRPVLPQTVQKNGL